MISQSFCRLDSAIPDCPVLGVEGEIDCCNIGSFRDAVEPLIGSRAIVLNFERAAYIDSAVINVIISLAKRQHEKRRFLAVVSPRATHIRRILNLTGIDELVPITESVAEATTALRPAKAAHGN